MKKLIIAAVAVAIIAPASVMAAGPTLYGKIHMSIDMKDNNTPSLRDGYNEWGLNSNSSRFGIKGSEDLGNGMNFGYLIEWTIDMDGDNKASDMKERNRAITLSGDWGTALVGHWDTPFKTVGRKLDLFGDQIGDTRNLSKSGTTDNRGENVLAYVTPNMNGLSATVAYIFDTDKCAGSFGACSGDNADSKAWSFNAIYNNGSIMAILAYVDYSDGRTTITASKYRVDASAWRVGGAYTFGDFKVLASYTDTKSLNQTENNDPSIWTIGGAYKMGNNTIKLQYSERDDADLQHCGPMGGLQCKDGGDMWSIGLDHTLSKRTTVYVAYATTDNNDDASYSSWAGGHDREGSIKRGFNADSFSVGIIHKF